MEILKRDQNAANEEFFDKLGLTGLLLRELPLLGEMEAQISSCEEVIHEIEIDSVLEGITNVNELCFIRDLQKGVLKLQETSSHLTQSRLISSQALSLCSLFSSHRFYYWSDELLAIPRIILMVPCRSRPVRWDATIGNHPLTYLS